MRNLAAADDRVVRQLLATPVLMLTARDELEAQVWGLEGGADDRVASRATANRRCGSDRARVGYRLVAMGG